MRRSVGTRATVKWVIPKMNRKYLRLVLLASLSIVFLASGCLTAGLLYDEANVTKAVLLFLATVLGAVGCIFFFLCFLRQMSAKL
jgi:hypothetical protein